MDPGYDMNHSRKTIMSSLFRKRTEIIEIHPLFLTRLTRSQNLEKIYDFLVSFMGATVWLEIEPLALSDF